MSQQQIIIIILVSLAFAGLMVVASIGNRYSLNRIKSRKVGDGQHGTARFATKNEIYKTYQSVPFMPKRWRKGTVYLKPSMWERLYCKIRKDPTPQPKEIRSPQGIIVGMTGDKKPRAIVDTGDVHTLMIGAAGVGKTACFLYPNLEYACATGMSFLSVDTKGDIARNYGSIARDCYGYNIGVIDLRNPTHSDRFNMLYLVNRYFDIYFRTKDISAKAKAEKYAKITAKTIITSGAEKTDFGQNSYFYDAAEGLLTAAILLVAEFCQPEARHIISVFKIIQDLLAPSGVKGKNQF